MNCLITVHIAVFALFIIGNMAHAAEVKQPGGPIPEIKKDCSICHGSHDMTAPSPLLVKPLSELCLDCHPDRTAPNEHVVDVAPKTKVQGLPLKDGKMTCVTCHDPHRNEHGKMLRVKQRDLCQRCHPY